MIAGRYADVGDAGTPASGMTVTRGRSLSLAVAGPTR